ncbi:MAG: pyrroline-5-carboxylate reductase [Eubacteriaceae bacterium]|nr:pyrroline-5-carboxylate reductase [Eubacteriaceae bacterium]
MDKKLGIIGCGNMAQAMIGGIVNSGCMAGENILVSDPTMDNLKKVQAKYGVNISLDNTEVAKNADLLIFAVKPNKYKDVLLEIKDTVKKDAVLISIVAAKSIHFAETLLKGTHKIVRTMPNTPALVGEAMTVVCYNDHVKEEDLKLVETIFSSFGKVIFLEEEYFDGATAVSGSSPASVYMLIEALADAAVLTGIPRKKAYVMAAQTVMGAAKMVLETGTHPGELKDMVCSPGGTSIEIVTVLEREKFRSAIITAVKAAAHKSKEMSKGDNIDK